MVEELSLDNILDSEEVNDFFSEEEVIINESGASKNEENKENKEETTETVDAENLFAEKSEGVGSDKIEDINEEKEDAETNEGDGTSPKTNFYSSIAKALKDEGVFPDLNDELIDKIKEPEDVVKAINEQINAGLEERQQRVLKALDAGVEDSNIRRFEGAINYLDSINEDAISDEGEKGETLRKQLIYQDFINRGYSKERAEREIKKSFDAGTDIEDAKYALSGNKEFFKKEYEALIEEAEKETKEFEKSKRKQAEDLKKSILEDSKVFGDLQVDKSTRQKIYDNISKPIYKDPESGELYTAVQKYEKENRLEFLKNVSLVYTLTDGFKNLDGLVKNKVKKEMKKGLRELEHTINNTSRTSDGSLKFISGVSDDPNSFIGKNWDLDI